MGDKIVAVLKVMNPEHWIHYRKVLS